MNKKNILLSVALIVVAILAGCSNQSMYPKFPVSALIRQTGDVVEGQVFDASKFEVVVNYLDNTTQTISGAGIQWAEGDASVAGMSADDTLTVNVGNDYYGKPVTNTISPTVLAVSGIEAVAKDATKIYTQTYTSDGPKADFVVKAYYSDTGFITLTASDDYDVVIEYAATTEEQATDEWKALEEVPGVATITYCGYTDTVDVTISKSDTSDKPNEIAKYASVSGGSSFAIPAYDYGTELSNELIDASEILIDVEYTEDSDETVGAVSADKVDGIELYFGDVDGRALKPEFFQNGFDFTSDAAGETETGIYVYANLDGAQLPGKYQVKIASTSIEFTPAFGLVFEPNTKYSDIKLDPADFHASVIIDGVKEVIDVTADMLSLPEEGTTTAGTNTTVTFTYNGLEKTCEIATGKAPATVSSVSFSIADTYAAPAGQYYDSITGLTISASDIEGLNVTMSEGVSKLTAEDFTWALYTDAAGKNPLSELKATELGYDLVSNDIYVGGTYNGKVYMNSTALTKTGASNVVDHIKASVTTTAPTVGSTATVKVYAYNTLGLFDANYSAYTVLDEIGNPVANPFTSGITLAATEKSYTVYADSNPLAEAEITVPAGTGYIKPAAGDIKLALKTVEDTPVVAQAAVGSAINLDLIKSFYEVDADSYTPEEGSGTVEAPYIKSMETVAPSRTISKGDNTFKVTIAYVDSTGKEVTTTADAAITGVAYVTTIDAKPVLMYDGAEIKALTQGTSYEISKFSISDESFTSVGDVSISASSATCTDPKYVTDTNITGDLISNYTLTFKYISTSNLTESEITLNLTNGVYTE